MQTVLTALEPAINRLFRLAHPFSFAFCPRSLKAKRQESLATFKHKSNDTEARGLWQSLQPEVSESDPNIVLAFEL